MADSTATIPQPESITSSEPTKVNPDETASASSEETTPTPPADVAGQPTGDETQPDLLSGKTTRLEQELSAKNELLSAIGIDPDSDIAQRYKRGIATREDILSSIPQPTSVPPTPPAPTNPMEKLDAIIKKAETNPNDVDTKDFAEAIKGLKSLAEGINQQTERANVEATLVACRDATNAVIDADPTHKSLPDDLREIEAQIFLGSTDNLLGQEAQKSSNPQGFFNAKAYDFYANENLKRYTSLKNHWIEEGKKQQRDINNPTPSVNPISPSVGTTVVAPPQATINVRNVSDAARSYVARHGTV